MSWRKSFDIEWIYDRWEFGLSSDKFSTTQYYKSALYASLTVAELRGLSALKMIENCENVVISRTYSYVRIERVTIVDRQDFSLR